jgi:mannose-6-phosphate isomerase-like protein (cupin superfamily)
VPAFDLETTYLAVDGRGGVVELPVGPKFWETIGDNEALHGASLLGVYPMKGDWAHWEMHPAGDEVLVLLDGAATMIFDESGAERRIEMKAGRTLVVPAGTWHRALVATPGRLLALTYGKGTEHRPV